MDSPQDKMKNKFEELNQKLNTIERVPTLSETTMRLFCIGFHIPLTGSLYYLLDNTNAYLETQCIATIQFGSRYFIKNFNDFEDFAKKIERITAPTTIDFTFNLTKSIYQINGVAMEDINVSFSVYFLADKYEVVYIQMNEPELRFIKAYNEDLEPSEVFELRDKICDYIFSRVANNIDNALSKL